MAQTLTRLIGIVFLAMVFCQSPAFAQVSPRLSSLLFGQLDFRDREYTGKDGFADAIGAGQFNLRISDRLSAFTEITATQKRGEDFLFAVERYIVRYDFSDQFKLSGGRYHTPIGYWNNAFHHGVWLQTTVGRPEVVKGHSYIIPIHFLGSLLEGNIGGVPIFTTERDLVMGGHLKRSTT